MSELYIKALRTCIKAYPEVLPYLEGRARWLCLKPEPYKTFDYMQTQVERLIRSLYQANISSEFIDLMGNLVAGQMRQAYEQAWKDEGTEEALPSYLSDSMETAILNQYPHVDGLFQDVVSARELKQPLEPLLARAALWATRWSEAYNDAVHLITLENGGKEEWVMDPDKEHCETCRQLNGIVAYAREWEELNVHPQGGPNDKLECGGWKCGCERRPTDKRRSPKAFDAILNAVTR